MTRTSRPTTREHVIDIARREGWTLGPVLPDYELPYASFVRDGVYALAFFDKLGRITLVRAGRDQKREHEFTRLDKHKHWWLIGWLTGIEESGD